MQGSGSITHHKTNRYIGGADKDADSIMIFQGFDKTIKSAIFKNRNQWRGKPAKNKEFNF